MRLIQMLGATWKTKNRTTTLTFGGELGEANAANPHGERHKKKNKKYHESDHGKAAQREYNQSEEGKNTRKAYRTSDAGRRSDRKYFTSEKHFQARARRREKHYEMRANQEFEEMDGTAGDVADDILGTHYEELDYETTAGWQERVGPGQYFVCGAPTESERKVEYLAILLQEGRVYPAIMKNPGGYPLEGRVVDPDKVEMLGLERFTEEELEGWDYINLLELDLTGREDSYPIYAVEQQLQYKTEGQELGYQRLNRVAGVGPWGNKPHGTGMVGFAYAPRGWLEAHYHEIAIVGGKKKKGAKDGTMVDLTGLAGILWASILEITCASVVQMHLKFRESVCRNVHLKVTRLQDYASFHLAPHSSWLELQSYTIVKK